MSGQVVPQATPVALSNTPQYFNFWNEKPIKPREWDVEMHAKTQWKHRGDYGAGKISHRQKKTSDHGSGHSGDSTDGHRNGWGNGLHGYGDGDNGGLLNGASGRRKGDGKDGSDLDGDNDGRTGDTVPVDTSH